jgi:lipid II isoglutaminyl synthase (glutamine-hydrolysing)
MAGNTTRGKTYMVKRTVTICHLYPRSMNIYGDTGNVIALSYRLAQRGIDVKVIDCEAGDSLPSDIDIIVAGGGQDSGQLVVEKDLQTKAFTLRSLVKDGVVILTICGTYQLFGHKFVTLRKQEIKGISIFDVETRGSDARLIGNVVVDSPFGQLVGFENHSGKTFLGPQQVPLGKVVKGAGNNGETGEEGSIVSNAFGTYMHGPVLPKNPQFADELLRRALERKYGYAQLNPLPDAEEARAARIAVHRPR